MTVAATQSAATALPAISTSAANSSGSNTSASGALSFTQNFNTFLTLLTTQLQNQDPLSPMDSSTFTQQLVSFSEVEQQIDTNNNLQSLISLQTAGETISSLPLVGQQIEYNSATAPLQDGQASYAYTLPSATSQTELVVTDANGNVIYNTAGNTAAGTYNFVWNGENNSGQQMPNDGAYTLQVVATNGTGGAVTATVQSIGTVNNVSVNGGTATFDVDGISVPMSELVTVNPNGNSSTSSNRVDSHQETSMSILGAMYAAVSGLNANSNALGIISDNIANSNTTAYKETSTDFSTLVVQSGITSDYSPGGVTTQPLYNVAQQGAIQGASSPTDLAISGGGFFVVNSNADGTAGGGTASFTRAGNFTVDANGNLVNAAGLYLQGQILTPAQSAAIAAGAAPTLSGTTVGSLQTVNVNDISETASPTANVTLAANLPANASSPETMTVPVYDSEGVEHDLTLTFTPSGTANQWDVSASFADAGASTATIAAGDNVVQFNSDGTLDAAGTTFNTANALSVAWDPTVSGGTSPQTVSFNLGTNGGTNGLSQLGNSFTVSDITQDGVQFGDFSSVSVGSDGLVTANFSNGLTRAIAIVPIATFEDPDGLDPASGNTYLASANSGAPLLAQAGTGSAGEIEPSSLEDSTVDIANEFSQLIIAQNAYSANSKVITTADQMTQALLSIQTG